MQNQQISAEENMTIYVQKTKHFAITCKQHSSIEDKTSRWGMTEQTLQPPALCQPSSFLELSFWRSQVLP